MSILGRLQHKGSQNEKKRESGGGESMATTELDGIQEDPHEDEEPLDPGLGPRTIYFNNPLPANLLDDQGHPLVHFRRNKIRTAKYTPLSFVPKNLWYQFHNIANVYFLFLIILAVSLHYLYQVCFADTVIDLQYLRCIQSRFERGTPNCHCIHNSC